MKRRHLLDDVSAIYSACRRRYLQASIRGDADRADQALSEMQQIERCITITETNTSWRSIDGREK